MGRSNRDTGDNKAVGRDMGTVGTAVALNPIPKEVPIHKEVTTPISNNSRHTQSHRSAQIR